MDYYEYLGFMAMRPITIQHHINDSKLHVSVGEIAWQAGGSVPLEGLGGACYSRSGSCAEPVILGQQIVVGPSRCVLFEQFREFQPRPALAERLALGDALQGLGMQPVEKIGEGGAGKGEASCISGDGHRRISTSPMRQFRSYE